MAIPLTDGDALTHVMENGVSSVAVMMNCEELKSLVDDDTFSVLRQHFLRTPGRGRPVDLPPLINLTNRVLIQLYLLKEEGRASFVDLQQWLCKIFPTVASVTKSRISHKVTSIYKQCLQLTKEEARTFLDQTNDFHALPPLLASLGLNRLNIMDLDSPFLPTSIDSGNTILTNDIVRSLEHFQVQENLSMSFVVKWIKKLSPECGMNDGQIRSKVLSVCKKIRSFVKNKKTKDLSEFLILPFKVNNIEPLSTKPPINNTTIVGLANESKVCKNLEKNNEKLKSLVDEQSWKIFVLTEENEKLRQKGESFSQVDGQLKEKTKENKSLKKQLTETLDKLDHIEQTRTYKQNSTLKKKLSEASQKIENLSTENKEIKEEVCTAKRKLSQAQTAKSNFKRKFEKEKEKCQGLIEEFHAINDDKVISLKNENGNRFTDPVRLAYMELQGKTNIAASKCSDVVQIVGKHIFGTNFTKEELPSSTSALTFADEGHHICMHQVVDSIKQSKHFTYASDGTSRQKKHFLERHIILDDKTQLSIGFSEIACDDAKNLMQQTIEMLDELSDIFCLSEDNSTKDQIFKELLSKLKCLLSDRASVNKLFNKEMSKYRQEVLGEDTEIHFLYCNAHFLLGLARATEEAVKEIEEDCCLGRDKQLKFHTFSNASESASLRLIRTAAECLGPRGDEKSGSRAEWLAFCEMNHISSKFVSYRSNRFNNLFENAAATLFHHKHILTFLSSYCTHSNLKLQSVMADVSDEKILSIIGAIALFNCIFTESYWKLMNSYVPYGAFPQYVKKLEAAFEYFNSHVIVNRNDVQSVFNDFEVSDPSTKAFLFDGGCSQEEWGPVFKRIVQRALVVLKRQLTDFLDGGIYGAVQDEETQRILDTCPLTNLSGERLFGDLDYNMLRMRHGTTHHHSSVTMWKHNKTAEWLENQNSEKRQKIMQQAVQNGTRLRKKHLERVKIVREQIRKKLQDTEQKLKEKETKDAQMKASILDGILAQGGVCETAEELQRLYKKCTVEDLKCQIRYRKVFLNKRHLKLTGTKATLFECLMCEIEKGGCVIESLNGESGSESGTE